MAGNADVAHFEIEGPNHLTEGEKYRDDFVCRKKLRIVSVATNRNTYGEQMMPADYREWRFELNGATNTA